jgi:ABC-type Fe3+ transport system permease subunit
MKRLFQIFELAKNEQRVVLIVLFILITFAFIAYERRVHQSREQTASVTDSNASPSPVETEDVQ